MCAYVDMYIDTYVRTLLCDAMERNSADEDEPMEKPPCQISYWRE